MAFADAGGYGLEALEGEALEGEQNSAVRTYSAQVEDFYWARNYWREPYFRADYDYEDYAPAYCVGYSGCAQYGGSFEEAEKSLCANFVRIKGDSRLSWEEALEPIRSAWNRVDRAGAQGTEPEMTRLLERVSQETCTA